MEFEWSFARGAWEEPGWTIDDHSNSGPVQWQRVDKLVIHYTSAADVPDGDPDELPYFNAVRSKLRATQRDYVTSRGYSIGYNACVTQNGAAWQLRGQQFMCAANHVKGQTYNETSFAVIVFVDGNDPASAAAVAAVRQIAAWANGRAERTLRIVGHRDLEPTGCPGAGLYSQITAGVFKPGDDDMIDWDERRLIDTREPPLGGRCKAGQVLPIDIGHPNGIRAIVNLQAGDAVGHGYVTASGSSKLPYQPGAQFDAIECTVPVVNGRIEIGANVADCHLVVGLVGVYV